MKKLSSHSIIGISIVAAVTIFSAAIVLSVYARYLVRINPSEISVTGSASMDFTSDLVVWNGEFSKTHTDLKSAYAEIKEDRKTVEEFLMSNGVKPEEFAFLSIDISTKYKDKNYFNNEGDLVDTERVFDKYELSQQVSITSNSIELIERVSNEVTDLIEKDVVITSFPAKYYYTKLGELKIEMIEKAAADGLVRAQTAVEGGKGKLGDLLETSIGVFQILGTNSNDSFSWGGTLNTSHKYKTAFVNVKQEYEIN